MSGVRSQAGQRASPRVWLLLVRVAMPAAPCFAPCRSATRGQEQTHALQQKWVRTAGLQNRERIWSSAAETPPRSDLTFDAPSPTNHLAGTRPENRKAAG